MDIDQRDLLGQTVEDVAKIMKYDDLLCKLEQHRNRLGVKA